MKHRRPRNIKPLSELLQLNIPPENMLEFETKAIFLIERRSAISALALVARLGMMDGKPKKLEEIGQMLGGVCKERARQRYLFAVRFLWGRYVRPHLKALEHREGVTRMVAGETLEPGDAVKIGVDGKVYRACP